MAATRFQTIIEHASHRQQCGLFAFTESIFSPKCYILPHTCIRLIKNNIDLFSVSEM